MKMEKIHLTGVIFLTVLITMCMATWTRDGSHLSGDNICSKRVFQSGWVYRNVSFKCWRDVIRPSEECSHDWYRWSYYDDVCYKRVCTTCYATRRVCVQGYVTKYFCCSGYEDNGNGRCVPSVDCGYGVDSGCDQTCRLNGNGHECDCLEGFTLDNDGRTCNDVDECLDGNGGCDQTCDNTVGSYYCSCKNGYRLSGPKQCTEVDECEMGNGGCEHKCINTDGAFYCECHPGYTLVKGFECEDTDECALHNGGCSHRCNNYMGSYNCSCPSGLALSGDGLTCIGAGPNPCEKKNGGCSHKCELRPNGYACKCPDGMMIDTDGLTCTDIGKPDGNGTAANPGFMPVAQDMNGDDADKGWIAGLVIGLLALLALIILAALLLRRYGRQWFGQHLDRVRGRNNADHDYATCGAGVLPSKIAVVESEKVSGDKGAAFDNHAYDYSPPKYEDIYEDMYFPGKGGAANSKEDCKPEVPTKSALAPKPKPKPKPAPRPENLYTEPKEGFSNPAYGEIDAEKVEIKVVPSANDEPTTSKGN